MGWDWWRKLPHLTYGDFGGRNIDHKPNDWMDECFYMHDVQLELADKIEFPNKRKAAKLKADHNLAVCLRNKPKGAKYSRPIYGPIYNFFAKQVFKPKKELDG